MTKDKLVLGSFANQRLKEVQLPSKTVFQVFTILNYSGQSCIILVLFDGLSHPDIVDMQLAANFHDSSQILLSLKPGCSFLSEVLINFYILQLLIISIFQHQLFKLSEMLFEIILKGAKVFVNSVNHVFNDGVNSLKLVEF